MERSSIQTFSWVTMQRLSGTFRPLIVRSVLPGKMIIGGKISQHAAIVRTIVTYFFSQLDVLTTVTDLQPFFTKDLLGSISKKTGVSSMLPTGAKGNFPIFKHLAHIS